MFIISHSKVVFESEDKSPLRSQETYFEQVIKGSKFHEDYCTQVVMMKYNIWVSKPMELQLNFSMQNVIQACLEYTNKRANYKKAEHFLNVIFNQDFSR